jgi:hypothetical protein
MTNNAATPVTASNALTTIILGGETQAQRMTEAQPTLVTMWAGNNDVLGALTNAANPGISAGVTSSANFNSAYDSAAAAIAATGAKALLIGVVDVTNIPYTSTGATIWCLKTGACGAPAAPFPATFIVLTNCAPNAAVVTSFGDSVLVPWSKFVPLIGAAAAGATDTLDCTVDTKVVTPTEYAERRRGVQHPHPGGGRRQPELRLLGSEPDPPRQEAGGSGAALPRHQHHRHRRVSGLRPPLLA